MCKCSATDEIALSSMQSNNVNIRLHNGMEVMFLMTVLNSKIKPATKTEAMFCST